MISSLRQLDCFNLSFSLAMEIFSLTRNFPKEERYSLTDQVVRSSRSIAANIAEGWGKRVYENEFKKHLIYAMGSLEETKTWLLFAEACELITKQSYEEIYLKCDTIGAKIFRLYETWRKI